MNEPFMKTENDLWLCLLFSKLPIEVFLRGLPAADQMKPVVVVERHRVQQGNARAAAIGIESGNSMDTAYTLSGQVLSFERDHDREQKALAQLAQWAYQFTPRVSIKAPDSLLLDLGGCLKLFNGLVPLMKIIGEGLAAIGYTPLIGVNRTPLAALFMAKTCTGPDWQQVMADQEDVATSLRHLPIAWLLADEAIMKSLQQMGIRTMADLFELPRSGLSRRFGVYFTDYLTRLTGEKPDPQKIIDPQPKFYSEITFLADVTNISSLIFPIQRLLAELVAFLEGRQLMVNHLSWKLAHRSHPSKSFSVLLVNPERDLQVFMTLTQLKLDLIRDVREIDNIALSVRTFTAADARTGDLFHPQDRRGHDQLLNILSARLGTDACFGLAIGNDHRPERAWKPVKPASPRMAVNSPTMAGANPRPVFLLETPKMLKVIHTQPCLGGRLELLAGPERIDFGWWDEPVTSRPIARDYYVARQQNGSLFWIFSAHGGGSPTTPETTGRWYLHGIFS